MKRLAKRFSFPAFMALLLSVMLLLASVASATLTANVCPDGIFEIVLAENGTTLYDPPVMDFTGGDIQDATGADAIAAMTTSGAARRNETFIRYHETIIPNDPPNFNRFINSPATDDITFTFVNHVGSGFTLGTAYNVYLCPTAADNGFNSAERKTVVCGLDGELTVTFTDAEISDGVLGEILITTGGRYLGPPRESNPSLYVWHSEGGYTDPVGTMTLSRGANVTIRFYPDPGYYVAKVEVGSKTYRDLGSSFELKDIQSNTAVYVYFERGIGPPIVNNPSTGRL